MLDRGTRGELGRLFGARVRFDEPLSLHTSMGVGGPADAWVEVAEEAECSALCALCRSRGVAMLIVGGGTNLIVRDGGFRGVAAKLSGRLGRIRAAGDGTVAGGGAPLPALVEDAARRGLAGIERLAGIPGTVGGAIRMNAGAHGASIGDAVAWARLMDGEGRARTAEGGAMGFSYRRCEAARGAMVIEAALRLIPASPGTVRAAVREAEARRSAWLPAEPNSGCVFLNPPGGPSAGEIIDRLGLKTEREGAAAVHARHANVIVNRGGAKARDVIALMRRIRDRVAEETGTVLVPELVVVGEDPARGEGANGWV